MISTIDITSFIAWFITQVARIIKYCFDLLNEIMIANNVSLLNLVLTITIFAIVIPIILEIGKAKPMGEIKTKKGSKKHER